MGAPVSPAGRFPGSLQNLKPLIRPGVMMQQTVDNGKRLLLLFQARSQPFAQIHLIVVWPCDDKDRLPLVHRIQFARPLILSGVQSEDAGLPRTPDDCPDPFSQLSGSLSGPLLLRRRSEEHTSELQSP